ncbi:MAG: UDP-3-O-(3-hydroxymyristoyl)glucosamine N-acyltransferase [Sinobacterium sp.]|nr:UDP-3-O-(3-hydroxymyristoyl)glucosamine N-acyltransferase [Sinobacterium sp.]
MKSIADIAQLLSLELVIPNGVAGKDSDIIRSIAPLGEAKHGDISFLSDSKYADQLSTTQASAVIVKSDQLDACTVPALVSANPYLSYAQLSGVFAKAVSQARGIHASATIADTASVAASASIGPNVVIGEGAIVGENTLIMANCVIGDGSSMGENCRLEANVTIYPRVTLGDFVNIHSGSAIGSQGFGFAPTGQFGDDALSWEKIHQLGGVRIGSHVDIGANTCIDCGTLSDTIIEDGVIIDNLVHIAHNCIIRRNTALAGTVGMAGSTELGQNVIVAGGSSISGHLKIAAGTQFTGVSMVTGNIKEAGVYSSGTGLMPMKAWRKSAVRFSQLDKMEKRLRALEKQLKEQ